MAQQLSTKLTVHLLCFALLDSLCPAPGVQLTRAFHWLQFFFCFFLFHLVSVFLLLSDVTPFCLTCLLSLVPCLLSPSPFSFLSRVSFLSCLLSLDPSSPLCLCDFCLRFQLAPSLQIMASSERMLPSRVRSKSLQSSRGSRVRARTFSQQMLGHRLYQTQTKATCSCHQSVRIQT